MQAFTWVDDFSNVAKNQKQFIKGLIENQILWGEKSTLYNIRFNALWFLSGVFFS